MMKKFFSSLSRKVTTSARIFLFGLVIFGLMLPVRAQAFQVDLTPTPTENIPPTALPPQQEITWRTLPASPAELASDRRLALLAGNLIFHGLVNAGSCPTNGLLKSGAANSCGLAAAQKAVILWQNQFDEEIYSVAQEKGIPPYILKNIFALESQFWPQTVKHSNQSGEYGLGHVTSMGADMLLRWNRSFYKSLCNQNFSEEACRKEYVFQEEEVKEGLKGLVLSSADTDCSTCAGGVDLQKARNSIHITAETLIANRNYVNWVARNYSATAQLSTVNMWRYSLASYNAGPGCFSQAFYDTRIHGNPLSWKDLQDSLISDNCSLSVEYVDFVMENVTVANPNVLMLAATDTSLAARIVLADMEIPTETPTSLPTLVVMEWTPTAAFTPTPTFATPQETPTENVTDTPTPTFATPQETPFEDLTPTPTLATLQETPSESVTGTPTPEILTETPSETPSSTPEPEITATATPQVELSETPSTATPEPSATESFTPVPSSTATPLPPTPIVVLPPEGESDQIMVKFGSLVPGFLVEAAVNAAGGNIQGEVDELGLTIISAPQGQVGEVLSNLKNNFLVNYAEFDHSAQVFYTPNDPGYINQTYLNDMQIPQAWDVTKGTGVTVAVIDTGMELTHADLAASLAINVGEDGLDTNGNSKRANLVDDDNDGYIDNWMGWNFVENNNDARDGNGHGTSVAGIIAAQMDNATGMAGIAPQAHIMVIKALDDSGVGTYAQAAQAIVYAVDHGAQVINLGFGGIENSQALLDATNYAYEHGVVVVAAGGNTASQNPIYPAANPHVIAVSALDIDLKVAAFSTYGDFIQFSAPGVGIYSTQMTDSYDSMSGSSMSAAQVSGIVALLASQPQFNSVDKVSDALFHSARDLGAPGHDMYYGNGLPQAFDALSYDPSLPTATATVTLTGTPPTSTSTPVTTATSGVDIQASEEFWASAQSTSCTLSAPPTNDDGISPFSFDGNTAGCQFAIGNAWTLTNFSPAATVFNSVQSISLSLRLYFSNWTDDTYIIQYATDGSHWNIAYTFDASTPPPSSLTLVSPAFTINVHNNSEADHLQVRIVNLDKGPDLQPDNAIVQLDQARLTFIGNEPPVITLPAVPANFSTFANDATVAFGAATATDDHDAPAVLNVNIEWYSNIDGLLEKDNGVDGFSTSKLTPGTHIITAQVTDSGGATGVSSLTLTITPSHGPHGGFDGLTDSCADCHRGHSAQGPSYLTTDPNSVNLNDQFCLNCHNGTTATLVTTHTNSTWYLSSPGAPAEASFSVRCVQCHDPHGSSNLFNVRTEIKSSLNPEVIISPMIFTALTGGYSFDDNASPNRLCVSCHTDTVNHPGGDNHLSGDSYTEQGSCIFCHAHDHGFMPVRTAMPPTPIPPVEP